MGRRHRRRKRRTGMGILFILVIAIFSTINIARARLDDQRTKLLTQKAELEQKIAEEEENASNIAELSAYVQTKKFVEETAREKFGLVNQDDVLFQSGE